VRGTVREAERKEGREGDKKRERHINRDPEREI